jgi:hypothetical protein
MNQQGSDEAIHATKGLEPMSCSSIKFTEAYGGFPDIWLKGRIFLGDQKSTSAIGGRIRPCLFLTTAM